MTKEEFIDWKKDFRTQEILANIQAHRLAISELMVDHSLILADNMERKCAYYIGLVEGLDSILKIEIENPKEEQDEHDDDGSPWTSSDN